MKPEAIKALTQRGAEVSQETIAELRRGKPESGGMHGCYKGDGFSPPFDAFHLLRAGRATEEKEKI